MSELKPKIKGGKLTLAEETFIKANVGAMTVEEIAKKLSRRPGIIENFLEEKTRAGTHVNETLKVLRNSSEYELLQNELSEKEVKIFEKKYCEWVGQFQGDIVFSEQNQIFNAIKQEIMMSSVMRERKNLEETFAEIDEQIKEIRESDSLDDRTKQERITNLRKDKTNLHGVYSAILHQIDAQQKLYNSSIKDLKATRAQRPTKDDARKNNILNLMKAMADDHQKIKMGEEAELERLSAEAEGEKFREPTQFLDGTTVEPFISGKE